MTIKNENEITHRDNSDLSIVSTASIGETNRKRVLRTLLDLGPTSRADLAKLYQTTRTTIAGIIQPLLDDEWLSPSEAKLSGKSGKPAKPIWFSENSPHICAVVIMPDRIESAILALNGQVHSHFTQSIDPETARRHSYEEILRDCVTRSLKSTTKTVLGIGISAAGLIDPEKGRIIRMNLSPALSEWNLRDFLEQHFDLKVVIDHHPRAILLGEKWFGSARGLKSFAIIYADDVLGCAVYVNDQIIRGGHGSGGEIGHMIVNSGGELCACGNRGCWETIASLNWLRREAEKKGLEDAHQTTVRSLLDRKNDARAKDLLSSYTHNLAIGIANLQTLLMPDNFIIYGMARHGRETIEIALKQDVQKLALTSDASNINILTGYNESDITLRGAAGLFVSEFLRIGN